MENVPPGNMGRRSLTDPETLERSREWKWDSRALSKGLRPQQVCRSHSGPHPCSTLHHGQRGKVTKVPLPLPLAGAAQGLAAEAPCCGCVPLKVRIHGRSLGTESKQCGLERLPFKASADASSRPAVPLQPPRLWRK